MNSQVASKNHVFASEASAPAVLSFIMDFSKLLLQIYNYITCVYVSELFFVGVLHFIFAKFAHACSSRLEVQLAIERPCVIFKSAKDKNHEQIKKKSYKKSI